MARKPHAGALQVPSGAAEFVSSPESFCQETPATHQRSHVADKDPKTGKVQGDNYGEMMIDPVVHQALAASLDPSGRKYCVPRMGSLTRRSNSCRSECRSTKSISLVLTTRRSDEV